MADYLFTHRARNVLAAAREEALALQHDYVGTEHILLGLIREVTGTGATALHQMGVEAYRVRQRLEDAVRRGKAPVVLRGELPYTSRAKKALEYAMAEARELHHTYLGTEHLILGLVREEKGIAAQVLDHEGITLESLRVAVVEIIARRAASAGEDGTRRGQDDVWYLEIDPESGAPIYEQIIARIEEAVATGQLESGERLPSVRELAAELGIAPGTVARAYSALEERGVVQTEGARGTRVAQTQPARGKTAGNTTWLGRLLKRIVVAAFHRGASAQDLRDELERAMKGILKML